MRNGQWKRLALAMCSGAFLCQVTGCAETAIYVSSLASVLTAGGVLYLVRKVID
jgi:hypothetical protein